MSHDATGAVIVCSDAPVRFGDGCGRKRRENGPGIRCTHPSAALLPEAIRVGCYKESPRGRYLLAAGNFACVRP